VKPVAVLQYYEHDGVVTSANACAVRVPRDLFDLN
jgi:hypothetical protein